MNDLKLKPFSLYEYRVWVYYSHKFAWGEFNKSLRELASYHWEGEGSDVLKGDAMRDMSCVFTRKRQVESFISKTKKLAKKHGVDVSFTVYAEEVDGR